MTACWLVLFSSLTLVRLACLSPQIIPLDDGTQSLCTVFGLATQWMWKIALRCSLPGFAWLLHSCFPWTLVLKDELPELGAAEDPEAFEDQTRLYSPCVERINSPFNVYIWHMTLPACTSSSHRRLRSRKEDKKKGKIEERDRTFQKAATGVPVIQRKQEKHCVRLSVCGHSWLLYKGFPRLYSQSSWLEMESMETIILILTKEMNGSPASINIPLLLPNTECLSNNVWNFLLINMER